MMKIEYYGLQDLLITFEPEISVATHQRVLQTTERIQAKKWPDIVSIVPGYQSILIKTSALDFPFTEFCDWLNSNDLDAIEEMPTRKLTLPVCYEEPYALDLIPVAARHQMSMQEVIDRHTAAVYRLYCMGFLPGFLYLGSLDQLVGQRLGVPRKQVPAGSVGIAGSQTGVYPTTSPGGWEIIGQCPLPMVYPQEVMPFPFRLGDQIQFEAITTAAYDELTGREWTVASLIEYCTHV